MLGTPVFDPPSSKPSMYASTDGTRVSEKFDWDEEDWENMNKKLPGPIGGITPKNKVDSSGYFSLCYTIFWFSVIVTMSE